MIHIAHFKKKCVKCVDDMLEKNSTMKVKALELSKRIQPKSPDGVPENVAAIVKAIEIGKVRWLGCGRLLKRKQLRAWSPSTLAAASSRASR
jgi:hypothetical protein